MLLVEWSLCPVVPDGPQIGGRAPAERRGCLAPAPRALAATLVEDTSCRKLCRGWSGGISVLVDESVTAGRSQDLEVSVWLVWWVGGDGWLLVE